MTLWKLFWKVIRSLPAQAMLIFISAVTLWIRVSEGDTFYGAAMAAGMAYSACVLATLCACATFAKNS